MNIGEWMRIVMTASRLLANAPSIIQTRAKTLKMLATCYLRLSIASARKYYVTSYVIECQRNDIKWENMSALISSKIYM